MKNSPCPARAANPPCRRICGCGHNPHGSVSHSKQTHALRPSPKQRRDRIASAARVLRASSASRAHSHLAERHGARLPSGTARLPRVPPSRAHTRLPALLRGGAGRSQPVRAAAAGPRPSAPPSRGRRGPSGRNSDASTGMSGPRGEAPGEPHGWTTGTALCKRDPALEREKQ